MFDPKTKKYPYPEYTDQHYLDVGKENDLVIDKNYPFIDNSFSFRFKKFWIRLVLVLIVFPLTHIKIGLRIKNRRGYRLAKKELRNGAITISNHIHLWDFIAINKAIRYKKPHVLVWDKNVKGKDAFLIRMMGGIPIPNNNLEAMVEFNKTIKNYLLSGGILQIYPEGSMWEYYAPIRPFKVGAASLAIKYNIPILPMGFSYRHPSKLRKLLFKDPAAITLTIGEPLYPDISLDKKEQELDLTRRAHEAVCELCGIDPKENLYEAIFHNNTRIDYY